MAVMTQPSLFGRLRRDFSPETLTESRSKELFEVLDGLALTENGAFPLETVLERAGDAAWKEDLVRNVMSGEFEANAGQVIDDGLLYLKKRKLMLQRKRVGERLRQVAGDSEETQRLMQEILFLDREITRMKGNV